MVKPRVFVTQRVRRRNPDTGLMEDTMNFDRASEYGEVILCLPHGRVSLTPGPTVFSLKQVLKDYCDNDYIVPTGDPSVIAMVGAIASNNNFGRFNILKWDKISRSYIAIAVDLFNRKSKED